MGTENRPLFPLHVVHLKRIREKVRIMDKLERLLEAPCFILDILPGRVPRRKAKEYAELEKEYLHTEELEKKFFNVLMKLRCYYDLKIVLPDGEETDDITVADLKESVGRKYLQILVEDSLIVSDPDDMYMSLFNPSDEMLEIINGITASEGMCVWESTKM